MACLVMRVSSFSKKIILLSFGACFLYRGMVPWPHSRSHCSLDYIPTMSAKVILLIAIGIIAAGHMIAATVQEYNL